MLKVVVFDGGCGGEAVANFLQSELSIIDVTAAIDWQHAPYSALALPKVCRLVDRELKEYIGKVDLIVLGGYTVTQALEFLRQKHPCQKFIGLGVSYQQILKSRNYPERVTVVMNENLYGTNFLTELRENLPFSKIILPDCSDWEELSNLGRLSQPVLYDDLVDYFALGGGPLAINLSGDSDGCTKTLLETVRERKNLGDARLSANNISKRKIRAGTKSLLETVYSQKNQDGESKSLLEAMREQKAKSVDMQSSRRTIYERRNGVVADEIVAPRKSCAPAGYKLIKSDAVLLLNTNYWELKETFENLFGYSTRVMDFRQKLLHDVCAALGLLGVDGGGK